MIINSSNVSMSANRNYASYTSVKSESLTLRADDDAAATIKISEESKNMLEQLTDAKKQLEEDKKQAQQQAIKDNLQAMIDEQKKKADKAGKSAGPEIKDKKQMQIETLKKILEMLRSMQDKRLGRKPKNSKPDFVQMAKEFDRATSRLDVSGELSGANVIDLSGGELPVRSSGNMTTWVTHTVTSSFVAEVENTSFSTTGIARTADGREISFNVDLEMSRTFMSKNETYVQSMQTLVDPLVINVGSNVTTVSDQKFLFDIDADGTEDEISYLGEGSGFLALDKNNDGTINDGNELFGTRSGNGFEDLRAYDEDGNGWIDEADSIFDKLKVWTKNEDGTDSLIAIGRAGVGAIYLGSAQTQFSLNNMDTNETNAVVQRTGIFLHEDGRAGTIQHVDFAI